MGSAYKDFLEAISPPWLRNPFGRQWTRALADPLDELTNLAKEAVRARFPLVSPEDAIATLGAERGIARGPAESTESYAARVAEAWETWPWAGTPYGMLRAFRAAGFDNVALEIVKGKQFTLDADGELVATGLPTGSWAIDATPAFWSKFQVLFFAPLPAGWSVSALPAVGAVEDVKAGGSLGLDILVFNDGLTAGNTGILRVKIVTQGFPLGAAEYIFSINDGESWSTAKALSEENFLGGMTDFPQPLNVMFQADPGTQYFVGDEWRCVVEHTSTPGPSSNEANLVRAIVNAWKPAHATCSGIILQGANDLWGYPHAGVTWGSGGTWGGHTAVLWAA